MRTDGVDVVSKRDHCGARAALLHGRHRVPAVELGQVALHRAHALHAVEAADRVQAPVCRVQRDEPEPDATGAHRARRQPPVAAHVIPLHYETNNEQCTPIE